MKIFKKIGAWLLQSEVDLAEGYKQQYYETRKELEEVTRERNDLIRELKRSTNIIIENERTISKIKDEIDIQKCKAAKYLSYYLEEMEKRSK